MKAYGDWYDGIAGQINQLKETLSPSDYKKYKLSLLLCVAERVAQFSPECGQCQIFRQEISMLTQDVGNLVQVADKGKRKAHLKTINRIIGHLQKQHKLVTEGYYMGIGVAIGSGIGVALGAVMDNVGSGIPIGVGVGVAIGASLDAKAKKEDRVICPEKTTSSFQKSKVIMVLIGVLLLAALVALLLYRCST